jgi:hypothetical protein
MTRRVALSFLLLVGLFVGLTLEPDSGTSASLGAPDVTGTTVGANHAKPLPRLTTVDDIARAAVLAVAVTLVLTLLLQAGTLLRAPRDVGVRRLRVVTRLPARRGSPALSLGCRSRRALRVWLCPVGPFVVVGGWGVCSGHVAAFSFECAGHLPCGRRLPDVVRRWLVRHPFQ